MARTTEVMTLICLAMCAGVWAGVDIDTTATTHAIVDLAASLRGATSDVEPALAAETAPNDDIEAAYLAVPSAARAREALLYYTSLPHVAGTPGDYETAIHLKNRFEAAGIPHVEIEEHQVLLSYPTKPPVVTFTRRGLAPQRFSPAEEAYDFDPTSSDPIRADVHNGYGPSGDVQGPPVYVNYGSVEDYETLARAGVNITGAVVVARYGGIFRGLKAMLAQRHGAVGCIIYSDPADDGFAKGKTYPDGPYRPPSGVQRGSVQFNSLCAGDPHGREEVCGYKQKDLIPKIPVQPLGYGQIADIMKYMGGAPVPAAWKGALDIPQYTYGGDATAALVRLQIENEFHVGPIWNVIGTIPGSGPEQDDMVLMGNHRDAWAFGAVDPNSGTAVLEEVARGYGTLLKTGWKPARTIVLCSWDGEEYGLLGSTAFGEKRAAVLGKRAVAYLNVDCAVAGPDLAVSATPSLQPFLNATISSIIDPRTKAPFVLASFGRLGSGSDYTVFLDHLGVASGDLTLMGDYGVYHSIYDSFSWMDAYGDPGFHYHRAMGQMWGLVGLRLATAGLLPFDYVAYATALTQYTTELAAAYGPGGTAATAPLSAAVAGLRAAAAAVCRAPTSEARRLAVNKTLKLAERQFLDPAGLPLRKWFQHVVQAPGLYEGYAANMFPGALQAVKDHDITTATTQIHTIAARIDAVAAFLGPAHAC